MELVSKCLKRKLPSELYAEIETFAHDLRPVMVELLEKHPRKIPEMLISFKSIDHAKYLQKRYKDDIHSICRESKKGRLRYSVEVGYTDSLAKVRIYRYIRQPRWMYRRAVWREVGVLI